MSDGSQSNIPGRTPLSDEQKADILRLDQLHTAVRLHMGNLKGKAGVDQRALAVAVTNYEQAHMWAVRAAANPNF